MCPNDAVPNRRPHHAANGRTDAAPHGSADAGAHRLYAGPTAIVRYAGRVLSPPGPGGQLPADLLRGDVRPHASAHEGSHRAADLGPNRRTNNIGSDAVSNPAAVPVADHVNADVASDHSPVAGSNRDRANRGSGPDNIRPHSGPEPEPEPRTRHLGADRSTGHVQSYSGTGLVRAHCVADRANYGPNGSAGHNGAHRVADEGPHAGTHIAPDPRPNNARADRVTDHVHSDGSAEWCADAFAVRCVRRSTVRRSLRRRLGGLQRMGLELVHGLLRVGLGDVGRGGRGDR